jgi:hypothetical protein
MFIALLGMLFKGYENFIRSCDIGDSVAMTPTRVHSRMYLIIIGKTCNLGPENLFVYFRCS